MTAEIEPNKSVYLNGVNIYLTPFTREHLEDREYWVWMNTIDTTKHLGLPDYLMPVSFEELEEYFKQNAYSSNNILFAVVEKSSDKFIGTVRVSHINWVSRVAVIGIMLGDVSKRGRGYAAEMTKLIVEYAFGVLNLNKLTASGHSSNIASLKCFKKLGFKEEGIQRKQFFMDGKYYDLIHLGLLEKEFRKNEQIRS